MLHGDSNIGALIVEYMNICNHFKNGPSRRLRDFRAKCSDLVHIRMGITLSRVVLMGRADIVRKWHRF